MRVLTAQSPVRLDAFVHEALPGLSRRLARLVIAEGAVRVNGQRAPKGTVLRPGDQVTLPDEPHLVPEPDLAIPVVFEDAALVAVDKPAGMPGHVLDPRVRGSVAGFLLARYPETACLDEPLAAGLVHRLDTGTSGLLLAARTPRAHAALRAAFRSHLVEKTYLAVVEGEPPGVHRISAPLAHDPRDRRRMVPAAAGARAWPAETRVEVVRAASRRSLVRAVTRTGVTHQVRAHLALLGYPLVGDPLYGRPLAGFARHALHAAGIDLPHPDNGRPVSLVSRLPPELETLVG